MTQRSVPPPRKLEQKETLDTLDHFKRTVRLFYKRETSFSKFFKPGVAWNFTTPNYGLEGDEAEEDADNLEDLLNAISDHLPFPYLSGRIIQETKNLQDVWDIFYQHYGCNPTQQSFLDYAEFKKGHTESYLTFYERLIHHQRTHLAPVGAAVGTGTANSAADKLTVSMQNMIAMDWLTRISPNLVGIVKTEFAVELKGGTQLASLVPRIANSMEALLKRNNSSGIHYTEHDQQTTGSLSPEETPLALQWVQNSGNQTRYQQRGRPWGAQRFSGRGRSYGNSG